MTEHSKHRAAGAAAGIVNGLFGGGGGMVLLPLLIRWGGVDQKNAFATCVAVIAPICCVSALLYLSRVQPPLPLLLPCLLGSTVGGILSGLTFEKVPVRVLRVIFGLFLLYGGVKYLI